MKKVPLREAKANFSDLLDDAEAGSPTVITRRGKEAVMLVPIAKGRKLYPELGKGPEPITNRGSRPNFVEYLMTFPGRADAESDQVATPGNDDRD